MQFLCERFHSITENSILRHISKTICTSEMNETNFIIELENYYEDKYYKRE